MLLRVQSDLHNEFNMFIVPPLPEDKDTVLILAGDIDTGNRIEALGEFLATCSYQFKDVIFVPGNHEYYHGIVGQTFNDIVYKCSQLKNVHIMDNHSIVISDVLFVCATMWSDFDNGNPITMQLAKRGMNDFNISTILDSNTRFGTRTLQPEDVYTLCIESKKFLFDTVKSLKQKYRKVVVVTHHCPSFMSVPERFKGHPLNGAFASSLENDILGTNPDLFIHGHTHDSFDYMVGETRIICNPRGYIPREANPNFNPNLVVDI